MLGLGVEGEAVDVGGGWLWWWGGGLGGSASGHEFGVAGGADELDDGLPGEVTALAGVSGGL